MLPSVFPRLATDSAGRVFPGVWKPLFLKFPSWDGLPYLFLKTMVCFSGCLMSSASLQKLFCGVCSVLKCSFEEFVREKVVFPSYSSAIFSDPLSLFFYCTVTEKSTYKLVETILLFFFFFVGRWEYSLIYPTIVSIFFQRILCSLFFSQLY